jgi:hypothetical protein
MLPNHHITKPVLIGEIQGDGQFDVVWKTRMIGWAPVRIARRHVLPALAKEGKSHPIHCRKLDALRGIIRPRRR